MAVLGPCINVNMNGNSSNIHNQLSKSLERILEDAYLSGELKLSGRKLKDFPKPVKHDLRDTVVADLSKNRFIEVPDEVTTFVYLEKLLISQNVINRVPDTVGCLQSLTYLDLSSNQLSELPREICQMPLQILLVQDNVLASLPKELGKMHTLAELDASRNRLTQVPMTLGDCTGLRALDLSNNQLGLLPLQITYLKLEYLDVSCNCISSLPLEFRNMHSLVTLNLEHNPLVSPPTTVCMRGRVHIFNYLEKLANKDSAPAHKKLEDTRRMKHNSYLSSGQQNHHHIVSGNNTIDCLRHKPRHVIDSGYSTDGVDKRWSNEAGGEAGGGSGRSTPSTPSTLSPSTALSRLQSLSSESPLAPATPILSGHRISPENMTNGDDKNKLAQQQTYRQYKEALRQQRQQDIYRPRTEQSSPDLNSPSNQSPVHLPKSTSSPQSPLTNGYTSNSPTYYNRTLSSNSSLSISISPNSSVIPNSPILHSTPRRYQNGEKDETKRPVQKVVPSRNNKILSPTETNINIKITDTYAKPTSPTKSPTNSLYNNGLKSNIPKMLNGDAKLVTTTVSYVKGSTQRSGTKMLWSKEVAEDKLSFTMKREFDKQKEETDLLQQLRVILESRLKMQLPEQLAPVLADGVVLCHLANHVRPRSVASVHVPSPAQPKLTMARCRRNVDNFLEACRKIGVEEDAICTTEDILELRGEHDTSILPLVRTVLELLAHATARRPQKDVSYDTQCNQSQCYYNNSEEYSDQSDISYGFNGQSDDSNPQSDQSENQVEYASEFVNETPVSYKIDYSKQTRYDEERYISNFSSYSNQYYTIEEKDEYQVNQNAETIECYTTNYENNENVRKRPYRNKNKVQFVVPFYKEHGLIKNDRLEIYDIDEVDYVPEDQIEERYDREKLNLEIPNNLNSELNRMNKEKENIETQVASTDDEKRFIVTCLCLGGFFMSVVILYLFPL